MNGKVGVYLVKIASVYMMIGLGLGMYVAISKQYLLMTVHSHLALLGWVTMALAGFAYMAAPGCTSSRLASWHFWLHNIGLPIMIVSLAINEFGNPQAEIFTGIGSIAVLLAMLLFTINILRHFRKD